MRMVAKLCGMKNLMNLKLTLCTLLLMLVASCSDDDAIQYRLTTQVSPAETGTITPLPGMFNEGTEIELKATPIEEYVFKNWTGEASGDENPLTIIMLEDKNITAVFEKVNYSLTIEIIGEGTVNQEIVLAKSSSNDYESGTSVELTAVPDDEWTFVGWSGDHTGTENPIQLTMDQAKTITVTFEKVSYELTIEIEGNGTVDEEIIQAKSSTDYESGTRVQLTAVPDNGWMFVAWSGDHTGTENPLELKIDQAKSITATFEKVSYELAIEIHGNGTVKEEIIQGTPGFMNPSGIEIKLTAVPDEGWYFVNWTGTITIEYINFWGDRISIENPIQRPVITPINLVVTFQENDTKTYVPDDNFEQALIALGLDDILDDYVPTPGISQVEELDIDYKNITDLTGIEDFVSLQILDCSNNTISTLDLSDNPYLSKLYLNENALTGLDISALGYISFLDARNNPLTCIQVNQALLDQLANPTGLWAWYVDEGVVYALDCPD